MKRALVVLGASLGGLHAVRAILRSLPQDFRAPILIVQHRRPDSDSRLAAMLDECTHLRVVEPDDKEPILDGTVYLSPADYHLLIDGTTLALSVDDPVSYSRPSIDVLFESSVESDFDLVIGVLLTASSEDGAAGIASIARSGGVTIVQSPTEAESPVAIVAALARCKVDHVLPLAEISNKLASICAQLSRTK